MDLNPSGQDDQPMGIAGNGYASLLERSISLLRDFAIPLVWGAECALYESVDRSLFPVPENGGGGINPGLLRCLRLGASFRKGKPSFCFAWSRAGDARKEGVLESLFLAVELL